MTTNAKAKKTDMVYENLRQAIMEGEYPPGSRVVAKRIAEEFGVSKVPVREALVRLAGEGWLRLIPHAGAVVSELSPDEIVETSLVRAAIEAVAVRLSTERLTNNALVELKDLNDQLDAAAVEDDPEYPRLNFDFHTKAFSACPYPALRETAASWAEKAFRLRIVRFLPEYLEESQSEHHELLKALEHRDSSAAEQITRAHIERAGQLLWQFSLEQRSHAARGIW